eukprot:scaffold5458_cov131-Isochrysis_galbana.AAC.6
MWDVQPHAAARAAEAPGASRFCGIGWGLGFVAVRLSPGAGARGIGAGPLRGRRRRAGPRVLCFVSTARRWVAGFAAGASTPSAGGCARASRATPGARRGVPKPNAKPKFVVAGISHIT